jgi:hypothetical protein
MIMAYHIASLSQGSSGIVSNQLAPDVLQHLQHHLQVTANDATTKAMGSAPILVANAPGANMAWKVVGFGVSLFPGANAVAGANGADIVLQANSTNVVSANIPASVITGNAIARGFQVFTGEQTPLANAPLYVTTANGANFTNLANVTTVLDVWAFYS